MQNQKRGRGRGRGRGRVAGQFVDFDDRFI